MKPIILSETNWYIINDSPVITPALRKGLNNSKPGDPILIDQFSKKEYSYQKCKEQVWRDKEKMTDRNAVGFIEGRKTGYLWLKTQRRTSQQDCMFFSSSYIQQSWYIAEVGGEFRLLSGKYHWWWKKKKKIIWVEVVFMLLVIVLDQVLNLKRKNDRPHPLPENNTGLIEIIWGWNIIKLTC